MAPTGQATQIPPDMAKSLGGLQRQSLNDDALVPRVIALSGHAVQIDVDGKAYFPTSQSEQTVCALMLVILPPSQALQTVEPGTTL